MIIVIFLWIVFIFLFDWINLWILLFINLGFLGLELNGLFMIILIVGNKLISVWIVVDFLVFWFFIIIILLILGLIIFNKRVNFIFFCFIIVVNGKVGWFIFLFLIFLFKFIINLIII